jgi:hypothetical protein
MHPKLIDLDRAADATFLSKVSPSTRTVYADLLNGAARKLGFVIRVVDREASSEKKVYVAYK